MAYKSLTLDKATPPRVRALIRSIETLSFSDVHTMLRLPVRQMRSGAGKQIEDLGAGCNFAIAHVLLAVIGGISATLYQPKWKDNKRFKGILRDYYPWNQEPPGISSLDAATDIYEAFRNPLVHDLGLDVRNKRKGAKLILKRLGLGDEGLSESIIERELEGDSRKVMSATLTIKTTVSGVRKELLVEALYWGVRQMIQNVSADNARMMAAEKFLANL